MDFAEIRKLQILDYLQANGHQPVKIKFGNAWYQSPLRQEKTPSFKVHLSKNLWYDFGTGEGGNLIDLVMKLHHVNLPETLELIVNNPFPARKDYYVSNSDKSGHIKIDRIRGLSNPALIQYIKSRNVSIAFARKFLKEAFYSVHEKRYFALAFKNDKDGFELRSAFFKTGSSPKYFTTIPGADNSKINVFEGFMDFLSCCSHYNKIPKFRTIVLNSLSFLPRIDSILEDAKEVNLFLDNDTAGKAASQQIITRYDQAKDWAPVIYPDHKDFNEFVMSRIQ